MKNNNLSPGLIAIDFVNINSNTRTITPLKRPLVPGRYQCLLFAICTGTVQSKRHLSERLSPMMFPRDIETECPQCQLHHPHQQPTFGPARVSGLYQGSCHCKRCTYNYQPCWTLTRLHGYAPSCWLPCSHTSRVTISVQCTKMDMTRHDQ